MAKAKNEEVVVATAETTNEQPSNVPMRDQFAASNFEDYDIETLVDMINATKGDGEFKPKYPEVKTYYEGKERTTAIKYVEEKGKYEYMPHGVLVAKGATIRELNEAYEKVKAEEAKVTNEDELKIDGSKKVFEKHSIEVTEEHWDKLQAIYGRYSDRKKQYVLHALLEEILNKYE